METQAESQNKEIHSPLTCVSEVRLVGVAHLQSILTFLCPVAVATSDSLRMCREGLGVVAFLAFQGLPWARKNLRLEVLKTNNR